MNSKNQSGPGFTATQPNSLLPEAGSTEFYSPVDGPDKDHLSEDISPNPKFECDGGESTNSGPAKWCPVSREAAEVIWNSLQIDANKIALDNEIEKLWVVGQHGGRPVAVLLWKNGFLGAVSLVWEKLNVKSLPAVSLKCGSSSIRGALASVFPGWALVPALVAKGYRGQALTDKLNEVLGLAEDSHLKRAVVTKAIRAEAWRRQAEAEERNDSESLSKAKLVIETLGLHAPNSGTAETANPIVKPSKRKNTVKRIKASIGAIGGNVPASNQGAATQRPAPKVQKEVM